MSSQTATILVTDLVGSTEMRARLGEEEGDRLHRLHDRLLYDAVESHGGVVVKGLGDGILASFTGATEAVAAAVAIQQAADFHTRRHPDQALVLRVGLSAGDVTVEEDGDRVGTPVIEAARLCAAASGGQILAAEIVRALSRGRGSHQFSFIGELELKGLVEPVAALAIGWEAGRPVGAEIPFPPLLAGGDRLGFAGRTQELELLEEAWKEAVSGVRRAVLLAGEPGVGKTRLAAELARRVHEGGGAVLYGRCEEDLGVPYEPFVEALRWFCEHVPVEELMARLGRFPGELARLAPELAVLGLESPLRSDPETEQYRFFEAVASWLAAAGDPGGLLLVVDDLHWAPAPTIALLAHVLRSGGPAPLLVVATFRDTDIRLDHPLTPVLADLRRAEGLERLALGGLSVDELAQLLKGLPQAQTARALAVSLHEATEGNPFFVTEVLRDVAECGLGAGGLPVPEGVREVIASRVARLSPLCRDLLGVAAVLGRAADLGPLARVAGIDEDAAVATLDEALAARLVEETGVGAYRFVHALVRSALYDSLSATRRARLHLRAADAFEDDPARLAHHLLACAPLGDAARTARACRLVGDRALSVLADAEAGEWYSRGVAFATDDPGLRIDLLIGLGEAQRRLGEAGSRQTLLDASRLATQQSDTPRLVRAVLANNRGIPSVIGDVDEERLDLIHTALDAVGPEPTGERAELLALQASELVYTGDHERVLGAADEAATIAAHLGDVGIQARVGLRRLLACLVPNRTTAMAAEIPDVMSFADATGDPQLRALSRALSVGALLGTGNLVEARRQGMAAMDIADETGQPGLRSLAHFLGASAIDALGDHEAAAGLTQFGFELGQQAGWPDAAQWYSARMWLHFAFEGQQEVASAVAAEACAQYPQVIAWQGAWSLCLAFSSQNQQLSRLLAGLPAVLPTIPVDLFWLTAHGCFATAHGFGFQGPAAATVAYPLLLPYRSLHVTWGVGYLGPVEGALAILARQMGDNETAIAHHEAAALTIDNCEAARARALNGYQWARTLLSRNAPGDRRRAIEIAHATLDYCRLKGYATFVDKTEELLTTIV